MKNFPTKASFFVSLGHTFPKLKTENEAGIMSWVSQNTTIPIPEVLAFDSSTQNPIGHEYILLSGASGDTLSEIYHLLNDDEIAGILDQPIDILSQLHAIEWSAIGGLRLNSAGSIEVGPVIEETFWQTPDIECYWPGETIETLNIRGPYFSYVEYISAHVRKYMYAISRHKKLEVMQDTLNSLETFLKALELSAEELNKVRFKLAHRDLHFGNILFDGDSGKTTAILDWEFSGIVPFTR